MLYRTVYGPELARIYELISRFGKAGIRRYEIYALFVPGYTEQTSTSTQNVDDALAFLSAAHLANQIEGVWVAEEPSVPSIDFRIQVLFNLRQLQAGELSAYHPADPTYLLLLEELFARPQKRLVHNLMVQANRLEQVQAVGGLNREKLQGWRRVMSYLGLGFVVQGEFVYSPDVELIMTLINLVAKRQGDLQFLVEDHLSQFVPCTDNTGQLY